MFGKTEQLKEKKMKSNDFELYTDEDNEFFLLVNKHKPLSEVFTEKNMRCFFYDHNVQAYPKCEIDINYGKNSVSISFTDEELNGDYIVLKKDKNTICGVIL